MTSVFCPAHITCFFRPVHSDTILKSGSIGAGIRLRAGTTVHIHETEGKTGILINGKDDDAKVTRHVLEHMAPGRNFDVSVECGLPTKQGFGMSASGAVAAALCISEIVGGSRKEAFEAAHTADAVCGGGLGDVSGLMHEWDVPIRTEAGLPPFGCAKDHKIEFERLTLIVIGGDMSTAGILADSGKLESICKAGEEAMRRFEGSPGKDQLFDISNKFSSEACLRGKEVAGAMQELENNGMRASMCMLGNSIFTDASEKEVRDAVGDAYWIFSTASTAEPARIIRKA